MLGRRLNKECEAWARAFALDPPVVEAAFEGFLAVLSDRGDAEASDAEAAKALSKMRKDLQKTMRDDEAAGERAGHLDDMATRLERSIGHAEILEAAGLMDALPDLKARLLSTRALVTALRAAIARRARS